MLTLFRPAMIVGLSALLFYLGKYANSTVVAHSLQIVSLPLFMVAGLRGAEGMGQLPEGPIFHRHFVFQEGVGLCIAAAVCYFTGSWALGAVAAKQAVEHQRAHAEHSPTQTQTEEKVAPVTAATAAEHKKKA